jgi:hypothetical protein
MRLSVEAVDRLFAECANQGDVLAGLYRMVLPDWERIAKVHGWPSVSDWTWKEISKRFMEFDRAHHPNCLPGGAWMNSGFSTRYGKDLRNWEVSKRGVEVEYAEEPAYSMS